MLRVYTAPSCASCRKVKAWLREYDIPFVEKNIFSTALQKDELKELLMRSENGSEDIISKRSKIIKEENVDIDSMTISELIGYIQKNPSILKRPIIIDERRFQVGYNNEEIRVFIPKELRRVIVDSCDPFCERFDSCGINKTGTNT